jgi:putative FmdB family regulatory protein
MPTYEYECTKCGHTFEAIQSMMDKPLSRCPRCRSSLRRLINGGMAVIFKGSGFYSTDNKKGSALSGGNGSSSREKEKTSDKPKEGAAEKSSTERSSDKSSEKSSTEKATTGKTAAS